MSWPALKLITKKSIIEFEKILSVPDECDINLWFEDDLFCQTNLWFTLHLLHLSETTNSLFLVRPRAPHQYGFSGYDQSELCKLFNNRLAIGNLKSLSAIWTHYQNQDQECLMWMAENYSNKYPFLKAAIQAHFDRIPSATDLGLPYTTIEALIKEPKTEDFSTIFQEFNKYLPIYGFGDLQVKRLFDSV